MPSLLPRSCFVTRRLGLVILALQLAATHVFSADVARRTLAGSSFIVKFDACSRWSHDAGVRGQVAFRGGNITTVELERCGLRPANTVAVIDILRKMLLEAFGPELQALDFAPNGMEAEYVRLFAEGAAASLSQWCHVREATAGHGAFARRGIFSSLSAYSSKKIGGGCDMCPLAPTQLRDDPFSHGYKEEKDLSRATLAGLAAASALFPIADEDLDKFDKPDEDVDKLLDDFEDEEVVQRSRGKAETISPDHASLFDVTCWLSDYESTLEISSPLRKSAKAACISEGGANGYDCKNFVYGSTYYNSWLHVVRTSPVAQALAGALANAGSDGKRNQAVVLGSSLGWQTFWFALTFGIETVGYDLMKHRVQGAMLAQERSSTAQRLATFFYGDVLVSNLRRAAVVYLTDTVWEDDLRIKLMAHIRKNIPARARNGSDFTPVIVSNKRGLWEANNFTLLGQLEVPVSWSEHMRFFFFSVARPKR